MIIPAEEEREVVTMSLEEAKSLRYAIGRSIAYLQHVYEIVDAELKGTEFEEDLDSIFREWRKGRVT